MKNQKNLWPLKGIVLSMIAGLLATGGHTLFAGKKGKKLSLQDFMAQQQTSIQPVAALQQTVEDILNLFDDAAKLDGQTTTTLTILGNQSLTLKMPKRLPKKSDYEKKYGQPQGTLLHTALCQEHASLKHRITSTQIFKQQLSEAIGKCCGAGKDTAFEAMCAFAKYKYKAIHDANSAQNKACAESEYQIIANTLRQCFTHMTQAQKIRLLLSACCKTDFILVADLLIAELTRIKTSQNPQLLQQLKQLQAKLSDRYPVQLDTPEKLRTPMHCIIRNADGSEQKSLALASREDTVRALLMFIVTGANSGLIADKFVPKGQTQPRDGAKIIVNPNNSLSYLSSMGKKSKTGSPFRYVNGKEIFDQNINISNIPKIVGSLKNMCHLCNYVLGKKGSHVLQTQKNSTDHMDTSSWQGHGT